MSPAGLTCLDVGSSTGGFTDCLLQHGATRAFMLHDVTTSQLDWKLRSDARVICVTGNVRYLRLSTDVGDGTVDASATDALAERPALITADLSFISVAKVLPRLVGVVASWGDISDFG